MPYANTTMIVGLSQGSPEMYLRVLQPRLLHHSPRLPQHSSSTRAASSPRRTHSAHLLAQRVFRVFSRHLDPYRLLPPPTPSPLSTPSPTTLSPPHAKQPPPPPPTLCDVAAARAVLRRVDMVQDCGTRIRPGPPLSQLELSAQSEPGSVAGAATARRRPGSDPSDVVL